jgi:DNA-binding NarL/FixJ family response regulator
MNGIQAAERLGNSFPKNKIIFMTVESKHVIVRAAFRVKGGGYILNRDIPEDLMVGVETVFRGERYTIHSIAEN